MAPPRPAALDQWRARPPRIVQPMGKASVRARGEGTPGAGVKSRERRAKRRAKGGAGRHGNLSPSRPRPLFTARPLDAALFFLQWNQLQVGNREWCSKHWCCSPSDLWRVSAPSAIRSAVSERSSCIVVGLLSQPGRSLGNSCAQKSPSAECLEPTTDPRPIPAPQGSALMARVVAAFPALHLG